MITVQIITDKKCTNRMQYVLDFMNHHPVCKNYIQFTLKSTGASYTIYYGKEKQAASDLVVKPQNIFFDDYGKENDTKIPRLYANCYLLDKETLYGVEQEKKTTSSFINNNVLSFDCFEMIFFHISRIEETWIKQSAYLSDKWQFEKKLFLVQNDLEKKPVVDELMRSLYKLITNQPVSNEDYKILSHDIDHIQLFNHKTDIFKKTVGIIYHRKGLKAIQILYAKYRDFISSKKDPYDTFDWMLQSDNDHKRIYFLVGGKHRWDSVYDLDHPNFRNILDRVKANGYKIGIHPSYDSWNNLEHVKNEKHKLEERIQQKINISRQHFLNFDIEYTPDILLEAGITTDSSLGYTRHTGYRCGTAYPYYLFDFIRERASLLREEPLVFMDMAWYYEAERTESWDISLDKFNGCFNFHNSFFFLAEQQGIQMKEAYLATFGS